MIEKTEYGMPSSNGQDTVHIIEWKPEGDVRGILQISHGMIEYIDRYDRFARFMADKGFVVIGNDHLGHGETAADKNFGYFAPKDGSYYVVRDLHRVSRYIRKKYPEAPFFLMGHSMGSFMARRYAMMYGNELDGLILMGSGSKPQWLLNIGKALVNLLSRCKGERSHSRILDKISFAMYNSHFAPVRTSSDWLTRDVDEVDKYRKHKYCQFTFTLNGYRTLFEGISYIQEKRHIHKIPRELPILFMSGEEDPVGNYGKGVKAVASSYRRAGVKDVTCILYPEARHELLNELEYEKTQEDMWEWIRRHGGGI
ncbi:MAG: lysophospholipase [Roseburia sp.]|nr:lysophospholipase [Roseburia sp.]